MGGRAPPLSSSSATTELRGGDASPRRAQSLASSARGRVAGGLRRQRLHSHCFRSSAVRDGLLGDRGTFRGTRSRLRRGEAGPRAAFSTVTSEWDSQVTRLVRAGRSARGDRRRDELLAAVTSANSRRARAYAPPSSAARKGPAPTISAGYLRPRRRCSGDVLFQVTFCRKRPPSAATSYRCRRCEPGKALRRAPRPRWLDHTRQLRATCVGRSLRDVHQRFNAAGTSRQKWGSDLLDRSAPIVRPSLRGATPRARRRRRRAPPLPDDGSTTLGAHLVGCVDGIIYLFLPHRERGVLAAGPADRRLHRAAAARCVSATCRGWRSPLEAFGSKTLRSRTRSPRSPCTRATARDHLVHRHTHRVVRGALRGEAAPTAASTR